MEETRTMDELLTALTNTRAELKTLQTQEKGLKGRKMELEARIASTLEQQGIDRVGNDDCTVSIKKRMSATAFRELLQMGMNVPGVKATELTRVNFRSK